MSSAAILVAPPLAGEDVQFRIVELVLVWAAATQPHVIRAITNLVPHGSGA